VFQFQSTGRACKYVDVSNSLMLLFLVPPWVNHPVKKKITHAAIKELMSSLLIMLYANKLKSMTPKRSMKFPLSSAVYTSNLTTLSLYIYRDINKLRKDFKPRLTICKSKNGEILLKKTIF
jgi:hypothetical protein